MPAVNESALPDRFVHATRSVAVICLLGLIGLGLVWELWLAPTGRGTLALKVMPLLLPLVGLLKFRMFTYRWLSLFVWIYFTEGVVRAMTEPGRVRAMALIEVALCVLLFAACAAHVRWRLQAAKTRATTSTVATNEAQALAGEMP